MAELVKLSRDPKGLGLPAPEGIDSWIRQFNLHFFGKSSAQPSLFRGVSHQGCLGVLDLGLENLSRFSLEVPRDRLLVVMGREGQFSWPEYTGSKLHPGRRHGGVLLPGDRLVVPVHSGQANLLLLSCSLTKLRGLALAHGLGSPDWSGLASALPSQQSLLHLCCSRLLALAVEPLTPMAAALVNSLEVLLQNSLVSLAGPQACSLDADNPSHDHVLRAIGFMKQQLDRPLTVEQIGQACHISPRTLQSAFKAVCHLTPIQTLQELRLEALRSRLQNGEDVASACQAVGLRASGRIAAAYRDRYGELPRETRLSRQPIPAEDQVGSAEVLQLFNPTANLRQSPQENGDDRQAVGHL
jgi:AraC-like DNA-binding protein